MRVCVYIDGFNLYYRLLKHSRHKWTNFKSLASELVHEGDTIQRVRYFTADVSPRSGDIDAPTRQQTYFRALKTIPELSIHKGSFLAREIVRPLVSDPTTYVQVHDTEEKGSDVNLASHLLLDAFNDTYDVALVLSQDTDLLEPIRMVREELGKIVIVGWSEANAPGKRFRQSASAIRHISNSMLARSQFPNPVIGQGGAKIFRPESWTP